MNIAGVDVEPAHNISSPEPFIFENFFEKLFKII